MRLLVVDDELKILALLKARFGGRGHEVVTTTRGDEAIRFIQEQPPFQLILLDLSLKGELGGREVLREAKQRDPATPVVIITGWVEAEPEECLRLGASGFLKKPIQLHDLDQVLQQVLGGEATSG